MATNEESSMRVRPEPESTVPLEYNQVAVETGETTPTNEISNADLLAEIQKMRSELIAVTEKIEKNQKDEFQELESKIEDNKKNLDGLSEKLQSIEELTSKVLNTDDNPKTSENTKDVTQKSEKSFKLKHVFKNAHEFEKYMSYYSEKEEHYNVKWYMCLNRHFDHLGFFVYCEPIAPSDEWSIRTKLEYKIVGLNQDVVRTCDNCYQKCKDWGFPKFVDYEEMKKWYLVDGNLTVEAKVTIVETTGLEKKKIRKFDESQKDVSDVILVVGNAKFYISKMYLASQSSVFKALLLGNFSESKQSKVKLNGIDPDNFQYFLEVLYGESAIDEANVEDIALLADMYDAPTVIRRCEEFLLKESKKTLEKKLEIATRFNLEDLKENCMSGNATTVVPKDSKVSKKNPLRKFLCL